MPLPDYYSRVNLDLLALIPPDAKAVLEIGCGAGALAEAYIRVNPGVIWRGIEPNENACRQARERMSWARATTAEDFVSAPPCSDRHLADCLILGDVLEHLTDPWAVLKGLARHLVSGAQVLASIPNIQHFATLFNLIHGNWDYTDEGTLDRTHLRFFTLKSIREMFDQAGLQIHEIRGTRATGDDAGWKLWQEFAAPLNIELRQTLPLQYIVRAIKPVAMTYIPPTPGVHPSGINGGLGASFLGASGVASIPKLHIHAVLGEACCARPRILEPFAAMGTIPGVKCEIVPPDKFFPNRTGPNILIQQRFRSIDIHHQKLWLIDDWLLIAELDDDPEGLQGYPENDYIQLRAVHAVQVSTERLAETVRKYNPNVMVFPNQIAELGPYMPFEDDGEIAIFYGAQNREKDWEPIMPAINRIIRDHHPDNLVFRVVHDKAFYDALETGQKTLYSFQAYEGYRGILRCCDIALLPLEPTRFNEHKSDIKFLEAAAEGVCPVAPFWLGLPVRGYESIDHFEGHLRLIIKHEHLRQKFAEQAYAYVRDHRMLGQHYRARLEWYQSLLSSKPSLDTSLQERVPELFCTSEPRNLQPAL
jgi:2-polyprenyl-3-methyl-5-hydroxy-6-metoxy-1,4-benzoquinol methylase